jgi:predicted extracellular nuclease
MSLIISGVIDGPLSGGLPKAIELTVIADIADLSIYGVESANNGADATAPEFSFPDVPARAGDVIYVASEEPGFRAFFGFNPSYVSSMANINGDDAILLYRDGAIVDAFGVAGVDGTGQAWDYLDGWAYRKAGSAPTPAFAPAEWTISGVNALDGATTNATAATPFPVGSFVASTDPEDPADGSLFSIAAADAERAEGDSEDAAFTFTVTRSGDVSAAASVDFAVSGDTDAADFGGVLPAGTVAFAAGETGKEIALLVSGDLDDEADEGFTVSLSNPVGGAIATGSAQGRILNDDLSFTLIHEIQGDAATWGERFGRTDATPFFGATVAVSAVVVGDFQNGDADGSRNLGGFYLQEEDADADGDAATSDGIFVFDGSASFLTDVRVGDKVTVIGTATEFFGETQIQATEVVVESSGVALPTAAEITFPIAGVLENPDGQLIADLEAYEGMLVTVPQPTTVADLFDYGRFGEIGLYANGRLEAYTQTNAPDVDGFRQYVRDAVANTITLNDGLTTQNPFTLPYPDGAYGVTDGLSSGDTVTGVTGVVRYSRGSGGSGDENYRINPTEAPSFEDTSPRRETPPDVGGSLKVASFNVLNYFNGDGLGGGFPTPRGADTVGEFLRQQEKLVAAIAEIDADVVGLIEIENDGYGPESAIASLVDALNTAIGSDAYAYVDPGAPTLGSDAIAVGFIYKTGSVRLAGEAAILDKTVDTRFDSDNQRPSLAQTFEEIASGGVFTAVVNHLKSKGSPVEGTLGDEDAGDGAGNANVTRTRAAEALADWIASDPTGSGDEDFLVIGDLNAYAMEDPIRTLLAGADGVAGNADDLVNLTDGYTYGFPVDLATAGQVQAFGSLDYAIGSSGLASQVSDAAAWNINADEPAFIDYNTEFKPANPDIYAPDAFRSSDHDPVLVGLDLDPDAALARLDFDVSFPNSRIVYSLDGEIEGRQRLKLLAREIDVRDAGITIDASNGNGRKPVFLSAVDEGLGVASLALRSLFSGENGLVDGGETLIFRLEETPGLGDALSLGLEFAELTGEGDVAFAFYDDGALVETAALTPDGSPIEMDLAGRRDFDRVDIGVSGDLLFSLAAAEFERITTDAFDLA